MFTYITKIVLKLRHSLLGLWNQNHRTHHDKKVNNCFKCLIYLLHKNMKHSSCSNLQIITSDIRLSVILSYLNKFLRTFLNKLIFLKSSDRIEKQSKNNLYLLLSKELQILLSFQSLIKYLNAFNKNSLDLKIIYKFICLVDKSHKNNFEDIQRVFLCLIHRHYYAHYYPFYFVYRRIVL